MIQVLIWVGVDSRYTEIGGPRLASLLGRADDHVRARIPVQTARISSLTSVLPFLPPDGLSSADWEWRFPSRKVCE